VLFDDKLVAEEVGPHVDPTLSPCTSLYRIVDFYCAANLVTTGDLYVPLASRFQDPNEGIEASIAIQAIASGSCAGVTMYFNSKEDFLRHQRDQQNRSYVSCWTKERESVAMWALYSPDYSAVQIETTVQSLIAATSKLAQENYNPMSVKLSSDQQASFVNRVDILSVQYSTLDHLFRRIDRRRRAFDLLDKRGKSKRSIDPLDPAFLRNMQRGNEYRFIAFSVKDSSFSHEREVRAIVTATPYDESMQKDAEDYLSKPDKSASTIKATGQDVGLFAARHVIRESSMKRGGPLPEYMSLNVDRDSILSVTIDPRCPSHKRFFIRDFFEKHKIPIRESGCFGHAAKSVSLIPRQSITQRQK
jgi:hypothetical protein